MASDVNQPAPRQTGSLKADESGGRGDFWVFAQALLLIMLGIALLAWALG